MSPRVYYIQQQRQECYFLYYFTTKQLVILQKEFAKILAVLENNSGKHLSEKENQVSVKVYPMLSCHKKGSCLSDLRQAVHEACNKLKESAIEKKMEQELKNYIDSKGNDIEDEVNTFLENMKDSGFSERLALRALQEVGPENIDEGS